MAMGLGSADDDYVSIRDVRDRGALAAVAQKYPSPVKAHESPIARVGARAEYVAAGCAGT